MTPDVLMTLYKNFVRKLNTVDDSGRLCNCCDNREGISLISGSKVRLSESRERVGTCPARKNAVCGCFKIQRLMGWTRLYSIGDVHEMTGISVSALRYYADMKIVCPAKIDRQTGYRYYDFDDIQRLKTVGYLKKAGFSLAEITAVMEAASEEERRSLMSERMEQTQKQMNRLKERMSMMEWLTSQNPVPEEGQEGYRIHQKQMDSRRIWMTETPKAMPGGGFLPSDR